MIKINQTRFGGLDSPISEQGNCFQACLASILEIPLEQVFDCVQFETALDGTSFEKRPWYVAFNEWLSKFGLASIYLEWKPIQPAVTTFLGYHMAECQSHTLKNGETHVVVIHNGEVVHDPNPKSRVNSDDFLGVYLLVPLDVANLRKPLPIIGGGTSCDMGGLK